MHVYVYVHAALDCMYNIITKALPTPNRVCRLSAAGSESCAEGRLEEEHRPHHQHHLRLLLLLHLLRLPQDAHSTQGQDLLFLP